jgi:hypothetical protein
LFFVFVHFCVWISRFRPSRFIGRLQCWCLSAHYDYHDYVSALHICTGQKNGKKVKTLLNIQCDRKEAQMHAFFTEKLDIWLYYITSPAYLPAGLPDFS